MCLSYIFTYRGRIIKSRDPLKMFSVATNLLTWDCIPIKTTRDSQDAAGLCKIDFENDVKTVGGMIVLQE